MPRNLYRRIEVVLNVPDKRIKGHLIEWLNVHLSDNVKSRRLLPDGSWERVKAKEGELPLNSQEWLIQNRGTWHEKA
jgi:polyphosphate kinase